MRVDSPHSKRLAGYNRAVVLDLIRRLGPISKSELAKRSGLAFSSVVNIVASLASRHLVRAVGVGPSTGGRPPTLIELNPDARFSVGINVRFTGVEAVLVDLHGDIAAEAFLPAPGALDPQTMTGTIAEAAERVIRSGRVDRGRVLGVGVGLPGLVRDGRVVVAVPGLPAWHDVPMAEQLERTLGLPVRLEKDANLGALAEYRDAVVEGNQQWDSLVYIYADHGINEGIVLGGKLYRGADGLAGELGHVVVDVDGRQCTCGNYGCLETLASMESIIRRTVLAARLGGATWLDSRVRNDWDAVTYDVVMEAVAARDPAATAAVGEAIACLAIGISTIIRHFRPQVMVVGGQMFDQRPDMFDALRSAIDNRPSFYGVKPTAVTLAKLGVRAPSIGAATLILDGFFDLPERTVDPNSRGNTRSSVSGEAIVLSRPSKRLAAGGL